MKILIALLCVLIAIFVVLNVVGFLRHYGDDEVVGFFNSANPAEQAI